MHTVYISIPPDICKIMDPSFYLPYGTFSDRLMQSCSTRGRGGEVGGKGVEKETKKEEM